MNLFMLIGNIFIPSMFKSYVRPAEPGVPVETRGDAGAGGGVCALSCLIVYWEIKKKEVIKHVSKCLISWHLYAQTMCIVSSELGGRQ